MSIGPILAAAGAPPVASLPPTSGDLNPASAPGGVKKQADPTEVSRQFEAILVRQILSESMKSLLENGKDGQVYGYFITEALADGITKGGGLGLRSVLETQLRQSAPPRPTAETVPSGPAALSVDEVSARKGYSKRATR